MTSGYSYIIDEIWPLILLVILCQIIVLLFIIVIWHCCLRRSQKVWLLNRFNGRGSYRDTYLPLREDTHGDHGSLATSTVDIHSAENVVDYLAAITREEEAHTTAEHEASFLAAQFLIRNTHGRYTLVRALPRLGPRISKDWFYVESSSTKEPYILSILVANPSNMTLPWSKETCETFQQFFCELKSPFLYPINEVDFILNRDRIAIMQPFTKQGSLRDALRKTRPLHSWSESHQSQNKSARGLPLARLRLIGRQVLEGIRYLHGQKIRPVLLAHAGNIMLEKTGGQHISRINGYETRLLLSQELSKEVLSPTEKPGFLSVMWKRYGAGNPIDRLDSIQMAALIYEMATGQPWSADSRTFLLRDLERLLRDETMRSTIASLLEFIFPPFFKDTDTQQLPSIDDIIGHPFFSDVNPGELHTKNMELSPRFKELLKATQLSLKASKLATAGRSGARTSGQRRSTVPPVKYSKETSRAEVHVTHPSSTATPHKTHDIQQRRSSRVHSKSGPLPPPPPPVPSGTQEKGGTFSKRNNFLADINKGVVLRRNLEVNDRSAPKL